MLVPHKVHIKLLQLIKVSTNLLDNVLAKLVRSGVDRVGAKVNIKVKKNRNKTWGKSMGVAIFHIILQKENNFVVCKWYFITR